jgi:hypothetical protein
LNRCSATLLTLADSDLRRSEASADAQAIGVELILFIASSARRRPELNA